MLRYLTTEKITLSIGRNWLLRLKCQWYINRLERAKTSRMTDFAYSTVQGSFRWLGHELSVKSVPDIWTNLTSTGVDDVITKNALQVLRGVMPFEVLLLTSDGGY